MRDIYRFKFAEKVPEERIEENLFWAVFNTESVFGKAKVRLDGSFLFVKKQRVCLVDKSTQIGQHIAQLFTSLMSREFGEQSFKVERISTNERTCHG